MTAIAYRDGTLAADSLTLGDGVVRGYSRKIVRSEKGTLGASAGLAGTAQMFWNWIENGRIDEWIEAGFSDPLPVNAERNQFGAIIVTATARVICVDWQGKAIEIDAPFYAEGGAEIFLIGAMAAGASAEEAVRLAIKYDVGCGGEVQVEQCSASLSYIPRKFEGV